MIMSGSRGVTSALRRPRSGRRPSEIYGIGRQLAGLVALRQAGGDVLPDIEHRALGRVALMADVRRHGGDIARLHGDAGARRAAVLVADIPDDLVRELD